jgi:transposase
MFPMNELKLTRWQRLQLQRQFQRTDDARVCRRTLAILEYDQGRPIAEIARMMGVTRQSVYNWVDAYAQDHDPRALRDDERSGRPTRWTEQLQTQLQTLMGQAPDPLGYFAVNWTAPLLRAQLERRTGQGLSEDTIRRELDRLGYVWKRSRSVLDPDPQREKKTLDLPVDPMPAGPERAAGGG